MLLNQTHKKRKKEKRVYRTAGKIVVKQTIQLCMMLLQRKQVDMIMTEDRIHCCHSSIQ